MVPPVEFSFADPSVADDWHVDSGHLELSTRHYKDGEQSLAWRWQRGGTLTCSGLALDPQENPRAGVKVWIYNEDPIDGNLVIELGPGGNIQSGRAPCVFRFHLDFAGWRACWLILEEGQPRPVSAATVEVMRLRAPLDVSSGTLYLDAVGFLEAMPNRSADYQMPEFRGEAGGWWQHQPLLDSREEPRRPLPDAVTEREREDLQIIRRRYETWLLGTTDATMADLAEPAVQQTQEYVRRG
jgi:chondroitin-sulfate-ABC endolyase/exolyase